MSNYSIERQSINATEFSGSELEADVTIIGSGAGGGITAEILAQAGFEVLLIEEGPYATARDFKMQERDAYPMLYQEAAARKTHNKAINILQGRSVGGSTTVNWSSCFRTPENTLQHWQKHFGLEQFQNADLAPWFNKAEKRLNIEPWKIPPNNNNRAIQKGAEKLGWDYHAIARNVKGCADLGYCGMGCPINAKQSMLVSTIPAAKQLGARVLYQARVDKLTINKEKVVGCSVIPVGLNSKATSAKAITIRSKMTILSAGAIGSPAILLRSEAPDPYKLIGKRTFLHPVIVSASFMPDRVNGYSGAPQSIYSDEFLWPKDNSLGYKIEAAPLHPSLASTVLSQFGSEHFDLAKGFPYMQATLSILRDGFSEQSRGGKVQLDKYQQPKLDYALNDYFWGGARKSLLSMAELQFAAGAKKVLPVHTDASPYKSWSKTKKAIQNLSMQELKLQIFSAHVMGGNGMGFDEKYSVVDPNGKFRHLDGLHIFDGSIFPTSIGANPQLSIYGIVTKLATELSERLKHST